MATHIEMGTYIGDGINDRLIPVTFQPEFVIVKYAGALGGMIRTSTMSVDNAKRAAAASSLETNMIKSFTSSGFTIGTGGHVNTIGGLFYWIAFNQVADFCKCVSYVGDGIDDRDISGVGFQPDSVLVIPSDAVAPIWLTNEHVAGTAARWTNGSMATNRIQGFNADGFQVGTDASVNTVGVEYHAWCLKKVAGIFNVLEWEGDGVDGRAITGAGFDPNGVILQGPVSAPVMRHKAHVGDSSTSLSAISDISNYVQAFITDGFEVGDDGVVNGNFGSGFYWRALVFSDDSIFGNLITQYVTEAIVQSSGSLPNARLTQYVVELIRGTGQTPGEPCAPTTSQQQTYPPCYGAEFDTYIAPDGHTYDFHVARGLRFLMTEEGFGMPAIQYVTSVGPYQHGETVRDWFLQPRIIQLMISNRSYSRQLYTAERAALLDAIRPNRQLVDTARVPGVLRKRLSDGSIRDLKVLIESGPGFGPRDLRNWDEYRFQEILRFIAHDPVLYNPLQQCRSFLASSGGGGSPGSSGGTQLVFPATFPITFGIGTGSGGGGSSSGGLSGTLQYNGTWEEYPQIVIHGPVISPVIENSTTGERLALETEILEGETVTFDLTYATKTVTKNDGTNMLGYLSDDSDLATFHLTTINSGANEIVISGSGTNAAMFVEFYYYERYIGR